MEKDTVARSLHDVGLASWFGGSLMGAVGLNPAVGLIDDAPQRARVANGGWMRWRPVSTAAIGMHVLGAVELTWANRARLRGQRGVLPVAATKAALTAAALGVTAWSGALGRRLEEAGDVPVQDGTHPVAETPADVAATQRQLRIAQWAVPALTGSMLVLNAAMGEQQRPRSVLRGVVARRLGH